MNKNYVQRNMSFIILLSLLVLTAGIGFLYTTTAKKLTNLEFNFYKSSILGKNDSFQLELIEKKNTSQNLGNILGGLFAGLLVAIVQYAISIKEKRTLDLIKALNVKNVLFNRANEDFYREIIKSAKNEIKIMGVTASRFINDFSNTKSTSASDKILINVLNQNVKVYILIPSKTNLKECKNVETFDATNHKMKIIKEQFPNTFHFRYFNHEPAHSIFWVDGESIIGPVIPNLSSKDTPGIHISNSSPFAKVYLKYFDDEWEIAQEDL